MKINLGAGIDHRHGYLNIDIKEFTDLKYGTKTTLGDARNLAGVVEPGTVGEIYASHLIEYFTLTELEPTFNYWKALLSPGGRLIIKSLDLDMVANDITFDRLAPDRANALLFPEGAKGMYSLPFIAGLLQKNGYAILSKTIKGHEFIVEAGL